MDFKVGDTVIVTRHPLDVDERDASHEGYSFPFTGTIKAVYSDTFSGSYAWYDQASGDIVDTTEAYEIAYPGNSLGLTYWFSTHCMVKAFATQDEIVSEYSIE